MASDSISPPPGGGGLKYGIIGLLLLAAAVGIWFTTRDAEEPPAEEPQAPVAEAPKRSSSLSQDDLHIPEEEPDAGGADEEPEPAPTRPRRRARATCEGKIDPAKVRAFIQEQTPQVRNCYERRLKVNNILQGRVDVRVRVKASGAVETVRVGGSLGDAEVYACVRKLAQNWQLPPLSEGRCAVMNIPFNLTPSR